MTVPAWCSGLLRIGVAGLTAALTVSAQTSQQQHQFLNRYCAACHSERVRSGGLSLAQAALSRPDAQPELWEKVARKLRTGVMPPPNAPLPSETDRRAMLTWMETALDEAAGAKPNPGRTETLRRLNRTEYQNAIRDLLAVDIDAASLLPADESGHGFDNVNVGDLPATLLNRYIAAAQKISRLAVGSTQSSLVSDTISLPADLTQEGHLPGLPIGTRGGFSTSYTFAQDGEYEIQVSLMRDLAGVVSGLRDARQHEMLLLIDREPVHTFTISRATIGDEILNEKPIKARIAVKAGPHEIAVTFVKDGSSLIETARQPTESRFNDRRHPRTAPAVDRIAVTGPYAAKGAAAMAAAPVPAPLADAVERRDTASLRKLLGAAGVDVNAAQVDGTTALHWAAYHDDAETAAMLVRSGAQVNSRNRYGVPPLAQACTNGNAAIVKLLLEAGADAKATLKGGESALMLAARAGNVEAVQALLARGADPKSRERLGQSALMWAAAEGHTAVVRALIDAGSDINATAESGFHAFFFALRGGHLDTVRVFLAAGSDVNAMMRGSPVRSRQAPGRGISPLMLAVQNGHFELAIALVEAGADPNDVRTGFTPLHMIAGVRKPDSSDMSDPAAPAGGGRLSSADFVREIVKRGAKVNFRLPQGSPKQPATSSSIASEGATPFLFAADRGDVPLMRLLLELGADPLLPNSDNTTPLMAAAGVGTNEPQEEAGEEAEAVEAVKMLLDLGAAVNTVDKNGDTAMHGAAYNISPLVVKLLAANGADPQVWKNPNKAGGTSLFIAEGYISRLPRPDAPTIEAITKLMRAAGISTEGVRPKIIDSYEKPAEPVTPQ